MAESAIEAAAREAAKRLGYDSIKNLQLQAVVGLASGRDVFGILPTGYGKSLCYGCLPWTFDRICDSPEPSIVCVVTPLTAIIEDQVRCFSSKGLTTGYVTGNSSDAMKKGVLEGNYQLIFFTPECLIDRRKWREALKGRLFQARLRALVIDEAHTVKKWGDTFRSILLRVGEIRSLLPASVKVLALTATATKTLRAKVAEVIGLIDPLVISVSPCKPNIVYAISNFTSLPETVDPLLQELKEKRISFPRTIVYCRTYDHCSKLYRLFKSGLGDGFTEPTDAPASLSRFRLVEMYTSCVDNEVKSQIVLSFSSDVYPLRIIFATVAFGMGLDCPDVRQIFHLGAPDDLESYIQETGRGGRDGKPSLAQLLVMNKTKKFCDRNMIKYQENMTLCRRDTLFADIDNYIHLDLGTLCMCCDVCATNCNCGACDSHRKSLNFKYL